MEERRSPKPKAAGSTPVTPAILCQGDDWQVETHEQRCMKKCLMMIPALQQVARELGYNLCVHGSLARDIDLVAVPWSDDAVGAAQLAERILERAGQLRGIAFIAPAEDDEFHRKGCPGMKPHRRLCWSFHLGGGPYLDLSVMPVAARTHPLEGMKVAGLTKSYVSGRGIAAGASDLQSDDASSTLAVRSKTYREWLGTEVGLW